MAKFCPLRGYTKKERMDFDTTEIYHKDCNCLESDCAWWVELYADQMGHPACAIAFSLLNRG